MIKRNKSNIKVLQFPEQWTRISEKPLLSEFNHKYYQKLKKKKNLISNPDAPTMMSCSPSNKAKWSHTKPFKIVSQNKSFLF
jgi:hypothetical protein